MKRAIVTAGLSMLLLACNQPAPIASDAGSPAAPDAAAHMVGASYGPIPPPGPAGYVPVSQGTSSLAQWMPPPAPTNLDAGALGPGTGGTLLATNGGATATGFLVGPGTANYPLVSQGAGFLPSYVQLGTAGILPGTAGQGMFNTVTPVASWQYGPAVDVVLGCGADPTGAASAVTAFNNCITTHAGQRPIYIPPGTYKIDSTVTIKDGLTVFGSPGALINASISSSLLTNSAFYAPYPSTTATTTLNGTPGLGSLSVTLTSATGFSTGIYVQIASATHSPLSSIYKAELVSGTTLTLDRPTLWNWQSGDTVNALSAKPASLHWYGGGMKMTGTAPAFFAGVYWDSVKQDITWSGLSGNNMDAIAGFNMGSFNSVMRNLRADLYGAGTSLNVGFSDDGENIGIEDTVVENGQPGSTYCCFKHGDSRGSWTANDEGRNCQYGLCFSSDSSGADGLGASWNRDFGGKFDHNTQIGILFDAGSSYNWVGGGATAQFNTVGGILADGTNSMTSNMIDGVYANNNTGYGVSVTAGSSVPNIFNAGRVWTDNNGSAGFITNDETFIGWHHCSSTAVVNPECLDATARTTVDQVEYNIGGSGVFGVETLGAARLSINSGYATLATNSVFSEPVTSGSVIFAHNVVIKPAVSATGTTGFYAPASAGTYVFGPGNDPSATATPYNLASSTANTPFFNANLSQTDLSPLSVGGLSMGSAFPWGAAIFGSGTVSGSGYTEFGPTTGTTGNTQHNIWFCNSSLGHVTGHGAVAFNTYQGAAHHGATVECRVNARVITAGATCSTFWSAGSAPADATFACYVRATGYCTTSSSCTAYAVPSAFACDVTGSTTPAQGTVTNPIEAFSVATASDLFTVDWTAFNGTCTTDPVLDIESQCCWQDN